MFFLSGKGCSEFPKRMLISIGILNLNKELEEQGYLTLRGKVPTKYFVKRFYGVEDTCEIPQEEGKEWFHA